MKKNVMFPFFLVIAMLLFPSPIFAYDIEVQVETNHYWGIHGRDMLYDISDRRMACAAVRDGKNVIKLLRPGDVIVRCTPMDGVDKKVYEVMLHVTGKAIDGSLIDPETFEEECLALVNHERILEGLAPLSLSHELSYYAGVRATEIAYRFEHVRPDGRNCFTVLPKDTYYTAGENIASNFPSPKDVIAGWMASPGHRKNILDPTFREMGIAVHIDTSKEGCTYWAQLFWSR